MSPFLKVTTVLDIRTLSQSAVILLLHVIEEKPEGSTVNLFRRLTDLFELHELLS